MAEGITISCTVFFFPHTGGGTMISDILFSLPLDGGGLGWGCSHKRQRERKRHARCEECRTTLSATLFTPPEGPFSRRGANAARLATASSPKPGSLPRCANDRLGQFLATLPGFGWLSHNKGWCLWSGVDALEHSQRCASPAPRLPMIKATNGGRILIVSRPYPRCSDDKLGKRTSRPHASRSTSAR